MLYLVLIASLCIFKASAQSCADKGFRTYEECEADAECYLNPDPDLDCASEGFIASICCLDIITTTEKPETTIAEEPTTTEECPTDDGETECDEYDFLCCPTDRCDLVNTKNADDLDICGSEDGRGECECASEDTTSTEQPTTTETEEPTTTEEPCPTDDGETECDEYDFQCCPTDRCVLVNTKNPNDLDICESEDGADRCECASEDTTTTEVPSTTEESTTTEAETTEAETTAAETTEAETTAAETTEAEESTTTEATEESTSTETPETTDEEDEETSTTQSYKWPTQKPTLPSAEKWEMIHPAYKGSDGELLWQVYYGDFSNDDRFDSFRSDEKWDTQEIKPIIMKDAHFKKYRNADSKKFNKQSAVVADNNSGAQSYGTWLIVISAVLIVLFAAWYKYGSYNTNIKAEYTPLLSEEKVQYDQ